MRPEQFQINAAFTPGAGAADVADAFVIYRPTLQIIWALMDGMGQDEINIMLGGSNTISWPEDFGKLIEPEHGPA